ncbi:DNA alkylation repair protein [Streptomyces sp. C10-9-1]|uniref:DNA alkylation repair protein n=1 Tax=Streptomyces sp. C10-9-1 TaxID=1859285 RepID=UPI003D710B75
MPTAAELLDARTAARLAAELAAAGAPTTTCVSACGPRLHGLGFTARVQALKAAVLADLPDRYPGFAAVVRRALGQPSFTGWMTFPVGEAVAERALTDGVFEDALGLLAELTPLLTSETAVRPFLRHDLHRALRTMLPWTTHADPHVRRLASEGTRPRLPWSARLTALVADPAPALAILDALHRDESAYVRRSVANHLNDISRDHPGIAVASAARWLEGGGTAAEGVARHGLRTLVKAGDPAALAVLGYAPEAAVDVTGPEVADPIVPFGGHLEFGCTVVSTGASAARLVIDYVLHHRRANGTLSPKVFKLTTRTLAPGERWSGTRRHPFRPLSTRRYHPGLHRVEIQVNGRRYGGAEFLLTGPTGPGANRA